MTTYYKAVRPDGTDFYSGTVAWLPPDGVIPPEGWLVTHPTATRLGPYADTYLSVSIEVADCTGMRWPCRLLRVEPAGRAVRRLDDGLPHKRCSLAWRVMEELPAHQALGPRGAEVVALLERAAKITPTEARALQATRTADWYDSWQVAQDTVWSVAIDAGWHASWYASREAAWQVAREATWDEVAAWDAWDTMREAVRDAVGATFLRNRIPEEYYDILMDPWLRVIAMKEDNQ